GGAADQDDHRRVVAKQLGCLGWPDCLPGWEFFLAVACFLQRAVEPRLNLVPADPRRDLAGQIDDGPEQFLQGLLPIWAVMCRAAGAHPASSPSVPVSGSISARHFARR